MRKQLSSWKKFEKTQLAMADSSPTLYEILVYGEDELRRLNVMAGIMIGISVIVHLIMTSGIAAPYGRYSSSAWGPPINAKLAWFLQEMPSFLVPSYIYFTSDTSQLSFAAQILMLTFLIHYFNRTFIYPFNIEGGKPTPLIVLLLACIFCMYNGYMQAMFIFYFSNYKPEYILEWNFVIGMLLFCFGFYINITSHDILRNLRADGSKSYKIPHGGMFEYIAAANLWGETVEWFGWGLACWSLQGFAFATFSFLYLSARSYSHHIWYLKKFEDYPKDRKIFIPYLL